MHKENSKNCTNSTFYSSLAKRQQFDDFEPKTDLRKCSFSANHYQASHKNYHECYQNHICCCLSKSLSSFTKPFKCQCHCYFSSLYRKFVTVPTTKVKKKKKKSQNIMIINQPPPIIAYNFPQQSQVVNTMINYPSPLIHNVTTIVHHPHTISTYNHLSQNQVGNQIVNIPLPPPNHYKIQQYASVSGTRVLPMQSQIINSQLQIITAPYYSIPKSRIIQKRVVSPFPLVKITNITGQPMYSSISRTTEGYYPSKININSQKGAFTPFFEPKSINTTAIADQSVNFGGQNTTRSQNQFNISKK